MDFNYKSFKDQLKEKNYENAFHILIVMINNMDPKSLKADKLWTKVIKENESNEVIRQIEKNFSKAPKRERKDIENKFNKIIEKHDKNINLSV